MKTLKIYSLVTLLLLPVFFAGTIYAGTAAGKKTNDQQETLTFKGKVVDAETGTPLVFATVAVCTPVMLPDEGAVGVP